jgi:hypothetical protein
MENVLPVASCALYACRSSLSAYLQGQIVSAFTIMQALSTTLFIHQKQ